ncbi:uncharacterized protein LOC114758373 [Neltuma alba]|uniref:uncharacterized protein LOC114758373 n=1 Tax=Neltuma alba TaxID=207710 RepID=UPI0010A3897E|nr:uncharacterized protein LOC114758373 [Prosopis alba]
MMRDGTAHNGATSEEVDALVRSRKKVRTGDGTLSNDQSLVPRLEDWMSDDAEDVSQKVVSPTKSYQEACSNQNTTTMNEDDEGEWWHGDGWKTKLRVEITEKGPNVIVLPEFQRKLAKKWETSLFVRLLGRMVREDYLGDKLQKMWGRHGEVETLEIGSGYFLRADFDPDADKVSKIAAWVRIPKFPVDYYDQGILYVVGNQIGRVLKVDRNTLRQAKGRFARLCVELDLNTPLLPSILINGKEKKIVYEGLHFICFTCGKYGHDSEHCLNRKMSNVEVHSQPAASNPEVSKAAVVDKEPSSSTSLQTYGEWMVAPRRRRPQRAQAGNAYNPGRNGRRDGGVGVVNAGSRFMALNDLDSEEMAVENNQLVSRESLNDVGTITTVISKDLKSRDLNVGKKKQVVASSGSKNDGVGRSASVDRSAIVASLMEAYLKVKNKLAKQGPTQVSSASKIVVPKSSTHVDKIINNGLPHLTHSGPLDAGVNYVDRGLVPIDPNITNGASIPLDSGSGGRTSFVLHSNPLMEDNDVVMRVEGEVSLGTYNQ